MQKEYLTSEVTNRLNSKEDKLPLWVRKELIALRIELDSIKQQNEELQKISALTTSGKKWFTLNGPHITDNKDFIRLWILNSDHPFPVCSLGRNDVLVIGRGDQ